MHNSKVHLRLSVNIIRILWKMLQITLVDINEVAFYLPQ